MDEEAIPGWRPAPGARCAQCGVNPVGPGGILCPGCMAAIEARLRRVAGCGQPEVADGTAGEPAGGGESATGDLRGAADESGPSSVAARAVGDRAT